MIEFELQFMKWLSEILPTFIKYLALLFTQFGGEMFLIACVALLYWLYDKKLGERLGYIGITSAVVNGGLKSLFMEKRPFQHAGYESLKAFSGSDGATGTSFPSGHSQNSGTVFTVFYKFFNKRWLKNICIALIVIVPITRIILGVHFPHDVLVGSVLGILIALLLNYLLTKYKEKEIYIYIISVLLFIPFLFINPTDSFYKIYGLLIGFVLGTSVEKKFIDFKMDVSLGKKILRLIVGLVILLGVKEGMKLVFGLFTDKELLILDLIRYMLIGVFSTCVVPLIFKNKFNSKGI